jgi:hypothetical protein
MTPEKAIAGRSRPAKLDRGNRNLADIAQLVARHLAMVKVAGSTPAVRFAVGPKTVGYPCQVNPIVIHMPAACYGGDLASTWSIFHQNRKPRSPVGLVNPPANTQVRTILSHSPPDLVG